MSVSFYGKASYILCSTTAGTIDLHSSETGYLCQLIGNNTWVWCCKQRPNGNQIASGCEDGTVALHSVTMGTVHGLHKERYAYRESLTDVVIHHLLSEQRVRIRCRDLVQKVAVFRNWLAVQLRDRAIVYEQSGDVGKGMQYRVRAKIHKSLDCNLLVVSSRNILLCRDDRLTLLNFSGGKEREWAMDSPVRYIKLAGGEPGREGLLVGLKSGDVYKVFVDNPFPISLASHGRSIRCLDISLSGSELAVVDDGGNLTVYSIAPGSGPAEATFNATSVSSASFSTDIDSLLCYSGNGNLYVKLPGLTPSSTRAYGLAVGFSGPKAFLLYNGAVRPVDVPLSAQTRALTDQGDLYWAHKVACLGVPAAEWRHLARECFKKLEYDVAQAAFNRASDVSGADLAYRAQSGVKAGHHPAHYVAELFVAEGNILSAARTLREANKEEAAVELLSDLGMFSEARRMAEESSSRSIAVQDILWRQAAWSEEHNDYRSATQLLLSAGQPARAIRLCEKHSLHDRLEEISQELDPHHDRHHLQRAADALWRMNCLDGAAAAYSRLGDVQSLMQVQVSRGAWREALALAQANPSLAHEVYLPRARALIKEGDVDGARQAYKRGNMRIKAFELLTAQAESAVRERRYADAAHYTWLKAEEVLHNLKEEGDSGPRRRRRVDLFWRLYRTSELYYAYDHVYRSTEQPFKTLASSSLLSAARFVLNRLHDLPGTLPTGISEARTYMTIAKEGERVGAHALARQAHNKLQTLRLPASWREASDVAALCSRGKPLRDDESILETCFRCGTANPLTAGEKCVNCGETFVRSLATFDVLPLVEFKLDEDISEAEAMELIAMPSPKEYHRHARKRSSEGNGNFRTTENAEALTLDEPDSNAMGVNGLWPPGDDPLAAQMASFEGPLVADRNTLKQIAKADVFTQSFSAPGLPRRFYRLTEPTFSVSVDASGHLFETEELDMMMLEHGRGPVAREPCR